MGIHFGTAGDKLLCTRGNIPTQLTASFWFRSTQTISATSTAFSVSNNAISASTASYCFVNSSNNLRIGTNGGNNGLSQYTPLTVGAWTHFAFVCDFVNGTITGYASDPTNWNINNATTNVSVTMTPTAIFVGSDSFAEVWKGDVAYLKIWNTLLTQNEFAQERFTSWPVTRLGNVYGWYPLKTHTEAFDCSRNGNHFAVTASSYAPDPPFVLKVKPRAQRIFTTAATPTGWLKEESAPVQQQTTQYIVSGAVWPIGITAGETIYVSEWYQQPSRPIWAVPPLNIPGGMFTAVGITAGETITVDKWFHLQPDLVPDRRPSQYGLSVKPLEPTTILVPGVASWFHQQPEPVWARAPLNIPGGMSTAVGITTGETVYLSEWFSQQPALVPGRPPSPQGVSVEPFIATLAVPTAFTYTATGTLVLSSATTTSATLSTLVREDRWTGGATVNRPSTRSWRAAFKYTAHAELTLRSRTTAEFNAPEAPTYRVPIQPIPAKPVAKPAKPKPVKVIPPSQWMVTAQGSLSLSARTRFVFHDQIKVIQQREDEALLGKDFLLGE